MVRGGGEEESGGELKKGMDIMQREELERLMFFEQTREKAAADYARSPNDPDVSVYVCVFFLLLLFVGQRERVNDCWRNKAPLEREREREREKPGMKSWGVGGFISFCGFGFCVLVLQTPNFPLNLIVRIFVGMSELNQMGWSTLGACSL